MKVEKKTLKIAGLSVLLVALLLSFFIPSCNSSQVNEAVIVDAPQPVVKVAEQGPPRSNSASSNVSSPYGMLSVFADDSFGSMTSLIVLMAIIPFPFIMMGMFRRLR